MADSPYAGLLQDKWGEKTSELIAQHPLKKQEIAEVVLQAWKDIFDSRLGPKGFQIGKDIFPQPQIMAFLLHELVPLELATRYPQKWRRDVSGTDKDVVYIPDDRFSVEIKTSSSANGIFGNRSYAQTTQGDKKSKSGYYLAVNFGGFDEQNTECRASGSFVLVGWTIVTGWARKQRRANRRTPLPRRENTNC